MRYLTTQGSEVRVHNVVSWWWDNGHWYCRTRQVGDQHAQQVLSADSKSGLLALITRDTIRALRVLTDLDRRGIAQRFGVSHRTVDGWEQGRYPMAGHSLLMLEDILDEYGMGRKSHKSIPIYSHSKPPFPSKEGLPSAAQGRENSGLV